MYVYEDITIGISAVATERTLSGLLIYTSTGAWIGCFSPLSAPSLSRSCDTTASPTNRPRADNVPTPRFQPAAPPPRCSDWTHVPESRHRHHPRRHHNRMSPQLDLFGDSSGTVSSQSSRHLRNCSGIRPSRQHLQRDLCAVVKSSQWMKAGRSANTRRAPLRLKLIHDRPRGSRGEDDQASSSDQATAAKARR